jgi:hypothetical protein
VGVCALACVDTANGVIEIGHLNFSPAMQRSTLSSEAIMLMIRLAEPLFTFIFENFRPMPLFQK